MARVGPAHPDLSAIEGAATPETADKSASVPDHVDGVLEVNPAGPGEGGGHRDVAQVRRGADAQHVLRGQDPGARGEDLVDVAVTAVGGQHAEVGHDGAVLIAVRENET